MQNLSYENEIFLHVDGHSFSYERLCTKTRFEKEVQGNSEMVYSENLFKGRCDGSLSGKTYEKSSFLLQALLYSFRMYVVRF